MSAARILPIIALALAITGCERKVDTLTQPEQANATASIVQPFKDRRVTNPFPDATEVRLFVEVDSPTTISQSSTSATASGSTPRNARRSRIA